MIIYIKYTAIVVAMAAIICLGGMGLIAIDSAIDTLVRSVPDTPQSLRIVEGQE